MLAPTAIIIIVNLELFKSSVKTVSQLQFDYKNVFCRGIHFNDFYTKNL